MNLQNIIHSHPIHGLAHAMDRMRSNIAVQRDTKAAYKRTHWELSGMSDRDLTDIGIDRADIPKVSAEAASLASS